MLKVSDEEQMKFAVSQKRAILTFDVPHFSQIHKEYREKRLKHYGIILSDQVGVRELLRRLRKFLNYMTAENMHNRIVYLSQWKNKT